MAMDRYTPERDVTPAFMARVASWIGASGEVLVILRYLRAAGAKDFALCRTISDFERLVTAAPRGTDIEVIRDPQLPVRGVVDSAFITAALESLPDESEYLLVHLETAPGRPPYQTGQIGIGHNDLREDLEAAMGEQVGLGPCPIFWVDDHEGLTSASKGGIDGPR